MNPDWQAFLSARGDGVGTHPPGETLTEAPCTLFDLSHLGTIAVRGADADTFLQGQFTNDVRACSATRTQLSGYCSPKGRLLALFRVLRDLDGIRLHTPRECVADTLKRLRLYVLRAKVTLEDASDDLVRIAIAGAGAASTLARLRLALPQADNELARTGELRVLRLAAPVSRYELIGPCQHVIPLWEALAPCCASGGADAWALLDIRAGIPNVYLATADAFVPQMLNLQVIDGVSFNKGCYVGQEVVARMQNLGRLKRRMYLARVECDTPPRPGDEVWSPVSTSEQGTGSVVDARPAGVGHYELLVVAQIEAAESGQVRLGAEGPPLQLQPPPYGFPAAN
jgi:tRNA-modifying protein YgfZ